MRTQRQASIVLLRFLCVEDHVRLLTDADCIIGVVDGVEALTDLLTLPEPFQNKQKILGMTNAIFCFYSN